MRGWPRVLYLLLILLCAGSATSAQSDVLREICEAFESGCDARVSWPEFKIITRDVCAETTVSVPCGIRWRGLRSYPIYCDEVQIGGCLPVPERVETTTVSRGVCELVPALSTVLQRAESACGCVFSLTELLENLDDDVLDADTPVAALGPLFDLSAQVTTCLQDALGDVQDNREARVKSLERSVPGHHIYLEQIGAATYLNLITRISACVASQGTLCELVVDQFFEYMEDTAEKLVDGVEQYVSRLVQPFRDIFSDVKELATYVQNNAIGIASECSQEEIDDLIGVVTNLDRAVDAVNDIVTLTNTLKDLFSTLNTLTDRRALIRLLLESPAEFVDRVASVGSTIHSLIASSNQLREALESIGDQTRRASDLITRDVDALAARLQALFGCTSPRLQQVRSRVNTIRSKVQATIAAYRNWRPAIAVGTLVYKRWAEGSLDLPCTTLERQDIAPEGLPRIVVDVPSFYECRQSFVVNLPNEIVPYVAMSCPGCGGDVAEGPAPAHQQSDFSSVSDEGQQSPPEEQEALADRSREPPDSPLLNPTYWHLRSSASIQPPADPNFASPPPLVMHASHAPLVADPQARLVEQNWAEYGAFYLDHWSVTPLANGFYNLYTYYSCLANRGGVAVAGGSGSCAQLRFRRVGNNTYTIQERSTQLYLRPADVDAAGSYLSFFTTPFNWIFEDAFVPPMVIVGEDRRVGPLGFNVDHPVLNGTDPLLAEVPVWQWPAGVKGNAWVFRPLSQQEYLVFLEGSDQCLDQIRHPVRLAERIIGVARCTGSDTQRWIFLWNRDRKGLFTLYNRATVRQVGQPQTDIIVAQFAVPVALGSGTEFKLEPRNVQGHIDPTLDEYLLTLRRLEPSNSAIARDVPVQAAIRRDQALLRRPGFRQDVPAELGPHTIGVFREHWLVVPLDNGLYWLQQHALCLAWDPLSNTLVLAECHNELTAWMIKPTGGAFRYTIEHPYSYLWVGPLSEACRENPVTALDESTGCTVGIIRTPFEWTITLAAFVRPFTPIRFSPANGGGYLGSSSVTLEFGELVEFSPDVRIVDATHPSQFMMRPTGGENYTLVLVEPSEQRLTSVCLSLERHDGGSSALLRWVECSLSAAAQQWIPRQNTTTGQVNLYHPNLALMAVPNDSHPSPAPPMLANPAGEWTISPNPT